jgi:hypothetical protein
MKRLLPCIALLVALPIPQGSAEIAVEPNFFQQQPLFQPPELNNIYDPQPGPFIVRLDESGRISDSQYGVIKTAVKAWSGPTLQAFMICFRSHRQPVNWSAASSALRTVAQELRAHEAVVVLTPNGTLCRASSNPDLAGVSHVEIMGVVRI